MLRRPQIQSGLLGSESNQQEIANSLYPEADYLETIIDDLPAFHDLRRANEATGEGDEEGYMPKLLAEEKTLAKFIAFTLKQRRGITFYEFSTVQSEQVKWIKRQTPKDIYSKSFEEIGKVLASLMWTAEGCVAIRIIYGEGIELGIYNGDVNELQYDPYLQLRYRHGPAAIR